MITFDNTQDSQALPNAQSWSFSYTMGAGINGILFIGWSVTGTTSDLITTAQYGGQNLTVLQKGVIGSEYAYLFMLVNPPTGTNNFSFAISGGVNHVPLYAAASYIGAKQSGQPDNSGQNISASAIAISETLATNADNCWTVAYCRYVAGGFAASAGTTNRTSVGNLNSGFAIGDSNGVITPPGNSTLGYQNGNGGNAGIGILMASFAPYIVNLTPVFIDGNAKQPTIVPTLATY